MNRKKFQECLNLFGADLEKWPEGLRAEAMEAARCSSEFQKEIEQERMFEGVLNSISAPPPPRDLAQRIVDTASRAPQNISQDRDKTNGWNWFSDLLHPKPAFALACLLVIGIILGIWARGHGPTPSTNSDLASLFNDEDSLWVTDINTSY